MQSPPAVLAFDVNETLLDLAALDGPIEDALGDAALRPVWFQTMLQVAFTGAITGRYVDYGSAQHAALAMIARAEGRDLDEDAAERVAQTVRSLPPHPDVAGGLARLAAAGVRSVALTNSTLETARDQIANAELSDHLEDVISADEVGRLKPAAEPYRHAAQRTGVDIGELMLVAAHHWDVTGALCAGARAALVARPGVAPSPEGPQPELVVADLEELAGELLG